MWLRRTQAANKQETQDAAMFVLGTHTSSVLAAPQWHAMTPCPPPQSSAALQPHLVHIIVPIHEKLLTAQQPIISQ